MVDSYEVSDEMQDGAESPNTYPMWLWGLAGMGLIWNLLGLAAFIAQLLMSPDQMATTPEELELYKEFPTWALIAFGAGTIGGTLGCFLLLLKSKFATVFFVISLIGVVVQQYYMYFVSNMMQVLENASYAFPATVLGICVLLLGLSAMANYKGWLR